jgi:hypothetical protein
MGPLKELHVLPASWYDTETVGVKKEVDRLIEEAKEQLQAASARAQGLEVPTRGNSVTVPKIAVPGLNKKR